MTRPQNPTDPKLIEFFAKQILQMKITDSTLRIYSQRIIGLKFSEEIHKQHSNTLVFLKELNKYLCDHYFEKHHDLNKVLNHPHLRSMKYLTAKIDNYYYNL